MCSDRKISCRGPYTKRANKILVAPEELLANVSDNSRLLFDSLKGEIKIARKHATAADLRMVFSIINIIIFIPIFKTTFRADNRSGFYHHPAVSDAATAPLRGNGNDFNVDCVDDC